MLGLSGLKARINHRLARLDAQEGLAHVAPLKRRLAPAIAAGLGATLMLNNYNHAIDEPARRKTLIRDGLVIAGTVAGLLAGWRFAGSEMAHKLASRLGRLLGEKGHVHEHVEEVAGQVVKTVVHHAHDHAGELTLRAGLLDRLGNLIKPEMHDHGAEGFIKLTSIAAGAILGGGVSGLAADAINGEDLKKTGSMKIKEGIFQFVGNITFCTAAILFFAKGGQLLGQALAKSGWFQKAARQSVLKTARTMAEKAPGAYELMPTSITNAVETLLKDKHGPAEVLHKLDELLAHEVPHLGDAARKSLMASLEAPLAAGKHGEIHDKVRHFVTEGIRQDFARLAQADQLAAGEAAPLLHDLDRLGAMKAENQSKLLGVLLGLVTGVVGGAWTSNHVNQFLSDKLGLAKGHSDAKLFSSGESKGLGAGTLGDRGIHWWDAILHIDDWPSALYLAGVQSLESIIGILYGISGYLTGTAGTDYTAPKRFPIQNPALYQSGLTRIPNGFHCFHRPAGQ